MAPKLNPKSSSQVNIKNENAINEGEVETVKLLVMVFGCHRKIQILKNLIIRTIRILRVEVTLIIQMNLLKKTLLIIQEKRKTSSKKVEKRAGIASRLQDSLDHILVGVESKIATKGDDPYSIKNYIKLLRKLPGLEPYSPQFYLGIRLMTKPQYRKTFIALSDDPKQQLGWLESFKLDDMNHL
ncbi:hypothetical protein Ahy_B04g071394 [Arachis hypogaea]|uniref:Uncharacterized protein n=1 Tax=Arachis hypogaea TaxID=3818 RepID=A0A444ZKL1_ARAHY|nr:hypothetical protein Ahy_B04g071394 [Arachis hypogaea]